MESLESFYFKAGFESVIKELQHYDFLFPDDFRNKKQQASQYYKVSFSRLQDRTFTDPFMGWIRTTLLFSPISSSHVFSIAVIFPSGQYSSHSSLWREHAL